MSESLNFFYNSYLVHKGPIKVPRLGLVRLLILRRIRRGTVTIPCLSTGNIGCFLNLSSGCSERHDPILGCMILVK